MRVAALVAEGCSNRDIATELTLSEQIVKNVIHSLFDKLGVWNRVELANRLMVVSSAEDGIGATLLSAEPQLNRIRNARALSRRLLFRNLGIAGATTTRVT